MSFRISGSEGYSVFFKDQDEVHEYVSDDVDEDAGRFTCPFCNTNYEKDLQLAAELGKTLLERNKELEGALRQQQNISDDRAQEIEYLRKQTAALREVNDSRMRIYEQLEVSIQDLEHTNRRLTTQSLADKKHISSLETQVEKLESKLEETQRKLEELSKLEKRSEPGDEKRRYGNSEEVTSLKDEISTLKSGCTKHQATLRELQASVDTLNKENSKLEEQILSLQHRQQEFAVLEQIGIGKICSRCLRTQDDYSMTGDEDSISIVESIMSSEHCQAILRESINDEDFNNPYRRLCEQYETLVMLQQEAAAASKASFHQQDHLPDTKCMSLQDELKMSGEFSSFNREIEEDSDRENEDHQTPSKPEFSETSSGFSDETINKGTQTDEGGLPGAFLCRITDGEDCKFSIYDDVNQIDSRFRKTPEYRKLFREIFDALKRAAEAKDEGEMLPLLEDKTPMVEQAPVVPPVTPSKDDVIPELSFASESSVPLSQASSAQEEVQPVPVQEKRDIIETLSVGLGGRKKKSRRHRSRDESQPSPLPGSSSSSSRKKRWHHESGRNTPTRPPPPQVDNTPPQRYPDFSPPSSASHEVARLKQIEKSYAEVLRMGRQRVNRK